jgi:hypothetical protein
MLNSEFNRYTVTLQHSISDYDHLPSHGIVIADNLSKNVSANKLFYHMPHFCQLDILEVLIREL